MTKESRGMIAASVAYTIFGLSYLFSKAALNAVEPTLLLAARFAVTVVALNVLAAAGVFKLHLRGKGLLKPVLLGLLQPVLYFFLENYGLKYTTASFTGMVSSISPVITALLGVALLRERPTARQWLFIAVTVLGVMIVSLGGAGGENTLLGVGCLLGAYAVGALYNILVRRLSETYSAFELTYVMFTVGFVFFAGLSCLRYGAALPAVVGEALRAPGFVVSVLYLGLGASVIAYTLANYALGALPVARSSMFSALATVVSVFSGVILQGDPFTWLSALSFGLILIGLYGVNRREG